MTLVQISLVQTSHSITVYNYKVGSRFNGPLYNKGWMIRVQVVIDFMICLHDERISRLPQYRILCSELFLFVKDKRPSRGLLLLLVSDTRMYYRKHKRNIRGVDRSINS